MNVFDKQKKLKGGKKNRKKNKKSISYRKTRENKSIEEEHEKEGKMKWRNNIWKSF